MAASANQQLNTWADSGAAQHQDAGGGGGGGGNRAYPI
jgi:hypothetical protein